MLFEKNITFDVKVEFEAPLSGYNVDEVLSPIINKMVKKTLKKFLNNKGRITEYTENNIKISINKTENELNIISKKAK